MRDNDDLITVFKRVYYVKRFSSLLSYLKRSVTDKVNEETYKEALIEYCNIIVERFREKYLELASSIITDYGSDNLNGIFDNWKEEHPDWDGKKDSLSMLEVGKLYTYLIDKLVNDDEKKQSVMDSIDMSDVVRYDKVRDIYGKDTYRMYTPNPKKYKHINSYATLVEADVVVSSNIIKMKEDSVYDISDLDRFKATYPVWTTLYVGEMLTVITALFRHVVNIPGIVCSIISVIGLLYVKRLEFAYWNISEFLDTFDNDPGNYDILYTADCTIVEKNVIPPDDFSLFPLPSEIEIDSLIASKGGKA